MEIKGYKAFNKDKTNNYGLSFEEGITYTVTDSIEFGPTGNGYHICTSLADVFRYVNATEEEVCVAEVVGHGSFAKYDDEYYGYYDMYACELITVERFLDRNEIIHLMLNASYIDTKKFIQTFRLNAGERMLFLDKYCNIKELALCILYYQFDIYNIYDMNSEIKEEEIRKVLKYGQNSN